MSKNDDVAYYECLYVIELKNGKQEIYARERLEKDDKKRLKRIWLYLREELERIFLPTKWRKGIKCWWFQMYKNDAPTELPSDKEPIYESHFVYFS